eukprot:m.361121 g.361121  ORF g.361121 m.361121 type:complete len:608 (+) comp19342_c0_seq1:27-1850(+)
MAEAASAAPQEQAASATRAASTPVMTSLANVKAQYDEKVAHMLVLLRSLDKASPETVNDIKQTIQELYNGFSRVSNRFVVRERRNASLSREAATLRAHLATANQFRREFQSKLNLRLVELGAIAIELKDPADQDLLNELQEQLKAVQTTLLDSEQWQHKMHALYTTQMRYSDRIEQLELNQVQLTNRITALETELTGRIQQIQFMSKGLDKADNPVFVKLMAEMQQNSMRAGSDASESTPQARRTPLVPDFSQSDQDFVHAQQVEDELAVVPREQPREAVPDVTRLKCQRTVTIQKSKTGSLGLRIRGGAEKDNPTKAIPVYVDTVYSGYPAAETGQLFAGDLILSINGRNVASALHDDIIRWIQNSDPVVLEVSSAVDDDALTTTSSSCTAASTMSTDFLSQAATALNGNRLDEAERAITAALSADATDPAALTLAAQLYFVKDDLKQANASCCRAILQSRTYAPAYHWLGRYFEAIGNLQDAHDSHQIAWHLAPSNAHFRTALRRVDKQLVAAAKARAEQVSTRLTTPPNPSTGSSEGQTNASSSVASTGTESEGATPLRPLQSVPTLSDRPSTPSLGAAQVPGLVLSMATTQGAESDDDLGFVF